MFCVTRAILYPGTKIVIASGTRGQSVNLIEKILLELRPISPELASEIDEKQTKKNGTDCQIVFKNTSVIKVVTASDSARGNRANVLILDEFRMISKDIVDTILRKFLTLRRMPKYSELTKEERLAEYGKERNKIMYLSSAYSMDHWSYTKCLDIKDGMTDEAKSDFICGLPYQLSIYEGLLDRNVVEDEMSESDFSEIKFSMEYEALFWGDSDGSFFDFNTISKNRKIKYPFYPDRLAAKLGNNSNIRIPAKQNGEVRILSADIALMSSKKHNNDATALFINRMIPTKAGRYMSNIVYGDSAEGMHTEDQALMIRKLYDEFQCDYIVLDTNGVGLGVFDCLARDMVDSDSGEIYPALSCCNDQTMAERCSVIGADRAIWSIKGTANLNSECAVLLREGFKTGKVRLLVNEDDGEAALSEIRGYGSLNPQERTVLKMPYIHTSLLINELVKLEYEETGGRIKVHERSGMRKDRYSSLSYNFYVATQLESKMSRRQVTNYSIDDVFVIKPPRQGRQGLRSGSHDRRW